MNTMGIIGYGSFGSLLAGLVAPHVSVKIYDQRLLPQHLPDTITAATIEEIAACSVVVIAVDLRGIQSVCEQLAPLVRADTVVMDVCSVKVKPTHIMQHVLGGKCRLLATHPMFGPSSVAAQGGTCKGLTFVWHELEGGPFPDLEKLFGMTLGAKILHLTPDEHDQQMAWVHALTFFVGRGLLELAIPQVQLDTGYYQKLRDLYELEQTHSRALFDTIEAGNPYAAEVRQKFLSVLTRLDHEVKETDL